MSYEVFEGYLVVGGKRISVGFDVPVGASSAQKDAAFLAALASEQKIEFDYLSIGEGQDRNIFKESLCACYLEVAGDPKYAGGRTVANIRSELVAQEILKGYPHHLINRETYEKDEDFSDSLHWLDSHFEFRVWEDLPLALFLFHYGARGNLTDKAVIAYPTREPNRDGVHSAYISLGELAKATPTPSGWLLPNGVEISFHQQPA